MTEQSITRKRLANMRIHGKGYEINSWKLTQ
jgi:hypothetical protein